MTPRIATSGLGPTPRAANRRIGAMAGLVIVTGVGALALAATWADHSEPLLVADLVLAVVTCAAMWSLRPRPEMPRQTRRERSVALGLLSGAVALVSSGAAGAALVGLFTATARASGRGLGAVLALTAAATLAAPLIYPAGTSYATNVAIGGALIAAAIGAALAVRARRRLLRLRRERAAQDERARQLQYAHARAAASKQLALEAHDTLTHRLAVVGLHAGALQHRPDAPAHDVARTVNVIRTTADAALHDVHAAAAALDRGTTHGHAELDARPSHVSGPPKRWRLRTADDEAAWNICSYRPDLSDLAADRNGLTFTADDHEIARLTRALTDRDIGIVLLRSTSGVAGD